MSALVRCTLAIAVAAMQLDAQPPPRPPPPPKIEAVVKPMPVNFQPYEQSDIGPNDCLSSTGDGSRVACVDIYSLWVWPINPNASNPVGAAADVGVKKMAEMINREQWLLPGYRLVPISMDDADDENIAYDRTLRQFKGIGYQKWVAMGSLQDSAGRAHHRLANTFQMPMIAGGAALTYEPNLYPDAILHWWNYQNSFVGLMHILSAMGVDEIQMIEETYLDSGGALADTLKKEAKELGVKVHVKQLNTGTYTAGKAPPVVDYISTSDYSHWDGVKPNLMVYFFFVKDINILQASLCFYYQWIMKYAGFLFILSDGVSAEFFTVGDEKSPWRARGCKGSKCMCTDEGIEKVANFMTAGQPRGLSSDGDPNDDTILGCFRPDADLNYARSKNATAHSFMEMMKTVTVKGGQYPYDENYRMPGYSSGMMCQLALMLRDQFDKGVTLQDLLQHDDRKNLLTKVRKAMMNKTFNGASGPVTFEANSALRSWTTDYYMEQNRTWVKFAEWDPVRKKATLKKDFTPVWRNGSVGWPHIPKSDAPCKRGTTRNLYKCEPCPPGRYGAIMGPPFITKAGRGDILCENCRGGTFSSEAGRSRPCKYSDRGHYAAKEKGGAGPGPGGGISKQKKCMPGTFQQFVGQTACTECEPGTYTNLTGATECERCDVGTYTEISASIECKSCGFGFTTRLIASTSVLDCGCPKEQYVPCLTDGDINPCRLNRSDYHPCTSCPESFECPGGQEEGNVTIHAQPKLLLGSFATVEEPYNAYTCLHAEDLCLGGDSRGDKSCGGGRLGIQCSECKGGYFSQKGTDCSKCSGGGGYLLVPCAAIITCMILSGVYTINKRGLDQEENLAERNINLFAEDCSALASSLIAFLSTCQILALFSSFSIKWPGRADSFFRFFTVLLSDMEVLGSSCFTGHGALLSAYLPNLLGPIAVLVLMCIVVALSRVLAMFTKMVAPMDIDIARSSIGSIIQTMAVALGASVLTIFECAENPSADSTLRSFDGFYCFGDEVMQLLPLGILGMLVYIVGVLAWFAYIIYVAPSVYDKSLIFRKRNRFLVQRWTPTKYWYGLPLLVRNYLMSMVPTMTIEPLNQLILAFSFLGALYVMMLIHQPWRQELVNHADAILTGSIFLVLFFGMALMPRAEGGTITFMSICMIVAFCTAVASSFVLLVYSAVRTRSKQHPHKLQNNSRERFFQLVQATSRAYDADPEQAEKAYNAYFNGTGRMKRLALDQSINEFCAYILDDKQAALGVNGIRRSVTQIRPIDSCHSRPSINLEEENAAKAVVSGSLPVDLVQKTNSIASTASTLAPLTKEQTATTTISKESSHTKILLLM